MMAETTPTFTPDTKLREEWTLKQNNYCRAYISHGYWEGTICLLQGTTMCIKCEKMRCEYHVGADNLCFDCTYGGRPANWKHETHCQYCGNHQKFIQKEQDANEKISAQ